MKLNWQSQGYFVNPYIHRQRQMMECQTYSKFSYPQIVEGKVLKLISQENIIPDRNPNEVVPLKIMKSIRKKKPKKSLIRPFINTRRRNQRNQKKDKKPKVQKVFKSAKLPAFKTNGGGPNNLQSDSFSSLEGDQDANFDSPMLNEKFKSSSKKLLESSTASTTCQRDDSIKPIITKFLIEHFSQPDEITQQENVGAAPLPLQKISIFSQINARRMRLPISDFSIGHSQRSTFTTLNAYNTYMKETFLKCDQLAANVFRRLIDYQPQSKRKYIRKIKGLILKRNKEL